MNVKTTYKARLWVKICLIVILIACALLFIRLMSNIFIKYNSKKEHFSASSSLISVEEIASLSVSEFVYNGIAQIEKDNGDIDYNILYNSTVKVSVDAENINYEIDDNNKTIRFTFSDFMYEDPIIDTDSLRFIPSERSVEIRDIIAICRKDALTEAKRSEKLIILAKDNLESIMEAWYSPIFDGYTFEFVFETAEEGGEAE